MAYVTTTDLSARLGATLYARLTDRVSGTTADASVAAALVAQAEAEADSYLARRFATPIDLAAHPELADVLALRVLDLAEYLAWKGSPFVTDLPGRVELLGSEARQWFERVAGGALPLPASAPPAARVAEAYAPRHRGGTRPFTAAELDGL